MAKQLPPPNPQRKLDVPSLLEALDTESNVFDRAFRGYSRWATVHRQMTQGLEKNEKKVGVPPLEYPVGASRKDKNVMLRDQIDLEQMAPEAAAPLIAGICQSRAVEMVQAQTNMNRILTLIGEQIAPITATVQAPLPPAIKPASKASVEDIEDDDEDEEEDEPEEGEEFEDDEDDEDEDDDIEEEEPEEVPPPQPSRRVRRAQG
jgi:hypothetical protein